MSTDIKERIAIMGNQFVSEGLVKPYVAAIDSALLKSNDHVWHASSMKEGIIPRSGIGIDSDARGGSQSYQRRMSVWIQTAHDM